MATPLYTLFGHLTPCSPFDWEQSLHFLHGFPATQGEQRCMAATLTKAVCANDQTVVFQIHSNGSVDAPQLQYTLFSDKPCNEALQSKVADRISFFLSLDDDLRPFYQLADVDPPFAPILQLFYGYHQAKFLTPFENACWAVLGQRTPMAVARKMKQAIIEKWGGTLEVAGVCYAAFPEVGRLVDARPEQLQGVIHNARKAEYIAAVARAFADVDEQWLRTAPYDEVSSWLRTINGIGAWSATFVLTRGLGRMERADMSFSSMADAVAATYGHGQKLTATEMQGLADHYGSYQGYWLHYLKAAA